MSPKDFKQLVSWQLGRIPLISFSVKVECRFGRPAVLLNEPLSSVGEPNPNLYYLSCPYLRKKAARLEDKSLITSLENTLKENKELAATLKKEQLNHRTEWSDALKNSVLSMSNQKYTIASSSRQISPPNIAAAKDDLSIKCLHAHIAWYLVHPEYRLGRQIINSIGRLWCDDDRCAGHEIS